MPQQHCQAPTALNSQLMEDAACGGGSDSEELQASSPATQKRMLGDRIQQQLLASNHPLALCYKITGLLIEGLDNEELLKLHQDPGALASEATRAIGILEANERCTLPPDNTLEMGRVPRSSTPCRAQVGTMTPFDVDTPQPANTMIDGKDQRKRAREVVSRRSRGAEGVVACDAAYPPDSGQIRVGVLSRTHELRASGRAVRDVPAHAWAICNPTMSLRSFLKQHGIPGVPVQWLAFSFGLPWRAVWRSRFPGVPIPDRAGVLGTLTLRDCLNDVEWQQKEVHVEISAMGRYRVKTYEDQYEYERAVMREFAQGFWPPPLFTIRGDYMREGTGTEVLQVGDRELGCELTPFVVNVKLAAGREIALEVLESTTVRALKNVLHSVTGAQHIDLEVAFVHLDEVLVDVLGHSTLGQAGLRSGSHQDEGYNVWVLAKWQVRAMSPAQVVSVLHEGLLQEEAMRDCSGAVLSKDDPGYNASLLSEEERHYGSTGMYPLCGTLISPRKWVSFRTHAVRGGDWPNVNGRQVQVRVIVQSEQALMHPLLNGWSFVLDADATIGHMLSCTGVPGVPVERQIATCVGVEEVLSHGETVAEVARAYVRENPGRLVAKCTCAAGTTRHGGDDVDDAHDDDDDDADEAAGDDVWGGADICVCELLTLVVHIRTSGLYTFAYDPPLPTTCKGKILPPPVQVISASGHEYPPTAKHYVERARTQARTAARGAGTDGHPVIFHVSDEVGERGRAGAIFFPLNVEVGLGKWYTLSVSDNSTVREVLSVLAIAAQVYVAHIQLRSLPSGDVITLATSSSGYDLASRGLSWATRLKDVGVTAATTLRGPKLTMVVKMPIVSPSGRLISLHPQTLNVSALRKEGGALCDLAIGRQRARDASV